MSYRAGRYDEAVIDFQALKDDGVDIPRASLWLARIYSKRGKKNETCSQLHDVLYPRPGTYFSEEDNPAIIAYYGDLCAQLNDESEARKAYLYACKSATLVAWLGPLQDMFKAVDRNDSTIHLRAAALAAATNACFVEESRAVHYGEEAVALDPQSSLTRLAYASALFLAGHEEESRGQAWMAERLSGPDFTSRIDEFGRNNIFLSQGYWDAKSFSPVGGLRIPELKSSFKTELPEER